MIHHPRNFDQKCQRCGLVRVIRNGLRAVECKVKEGIYRISDWRSLLNYLSTNSFNDNCIGTYSSLHDWINAGKADGLNGI